jgi:hypothetical protein
VLIRALEVLESRGEKRDFDEPEARQIVLRDKPGRPRNDENNSHDHENIRGRTDTVAYVKARLRRDDPDLAARVERGELTANAAAVAKGWRKRPEPYRQLVLWWDRATPQDRACFHTYLKAWAEKEDA